MSYDQIAVALEVPVGTVRSRLNRARRRLRELVGAHEEEQAAATLRPDRVLPVDEGDPGLFKREKEKLMTEIAGPMPQAQAWSRTPSMYPRLAYVDEVAALDYLTGCSSSPNGARRGWAAAMTTKRACWPGSSSATAWS